MPRPVPTHLRLVFRGTIVDTPEQWSFGLNLRRDVDASPDLDTSNINGDDVWAAITGLVAYCSDRVRCDEWRAYVIGADGLMEGNPRVEMRPAASAPRGTNTGHRWPPQCALAVTLEGDSRGPGRFGRFFLPLPGAALGDDLRITTSQADGFMTGVTGFLQAIRNSRAANNAPDLGTHQIINVSSLPAASGGSYQPVTRVRLGRVVDTISRRRRQMEEDYRVATIENDF